MKLGTGLIATMTALVLGLMTASAKSSFDAHSLSPQIVRIRTKQLQQPLHQLAAPPGDVLGCEKND